MAHKIDKEIIYIAVNKITNKSYIGQTISGLKSRRGSNISNAYNINTREYNTVFSRAVRKYGAQAWQWSVLYEAGNKHDLDEYERFYIDLYDSYNNGYNSTRGGAGNKGVRLSAETKHKISVSRIGKKHSEQTKAKISASNKGKSRNKGRVASDETRAKMSLSRKNRPPMSDETKKKLSKSNMGKNVGPRSESVKQKISDSKSVYSYIATCPDGISEEIRNINAYCKRYGLDSSKMYAVCNNKLKQHKGYRVQRS